MKNTQKRLMQYGFGGGDPANPAPVRLTPEQIAMKYKGNQYVKGREGWGAALDQSLGGTKVRDLATNASKAAGFSDPTLLYASAMEEGMQTAFKDPNAISGAYEDAKIDSKAFPVDGFYRYGLDQFGGQAEALAKKGYLPKGFETKYKTFKASNEDDEKLYYGETAKVLGKDEAYQKQFINKKTGKLNTSAYYDALDKEVKGYKGTTALPKKKQSANTAAFATDQDALTAKAAMLRDTQDQLDAYAKEKKLNLSQKQKEYFTLAGYNGGTGNMRKMIKSYGEKGYLKDDKFLDASFTPESYGEINTNVQRRLQNRNVLKTEGFFATGGEAGMSQQGMDMLGQLPAMANMLIDTFENNPNNYSRQPTLNADTMRQMVTPYALGGDTGDEDMMEQLQAMADEQGIPVEELIAMLQEQQQGAAEEGGVEVMDEESEAEEAPEGEDFMASQFAYGGQPGKKKIEVEDNEVIETPDGKISQMKGKTHEQGGIPVAVPSGSKIYSDRLKIDGKTMQARKLAREKRIKIIERQLIERPGDKLLQGSYERTLTTHQKEEAMDMNLQKFLNTMFNKTGEVPEMGYGGKVDSYAYGGFEGYDIGEPVPLNKKKFNKQAILDYGMKIPGFQQFMQERKIEQMRADLDKPTAVTGTPPQQPKKEEEGDVDLTDKLTAGDYVGMAGNLFNAVAPIINTNKNRQGKKPNINRYLGFGHDALEDNAEAQTIAGTLRAEHLTDIETDRGTSALRNRGSAMSVNTLRALDSITDMGVSKAKQSANDTFSKTMMNLMTQRGQLENIQDRMEMAGEERRDIEDKADMDNYSSNMAENLVNAGTNIQGLGKNLNQSHENTVNAELLSQLSQYGLAINPNTGKLVTKKKK